MKFGILTLSVLFAGLLLMNITGCGTSQRGTTDTLGSYSANVNGTPDKATKAAEKSCEDLKLTDIVATGTKVDGKVTAKNAQGDTITINIEQSGENVSKVSIRVGTTGDDAVSKQLIDGINSHLASWL